MHHVLCRICHFIYYSLYAYQIKDKFSDLIGQNEGQCYYENKLQKGKSKLSDRKLGDRKLKDDRLMDPRFCIEYCKNEGFAFAGLQNSDECFCGNNKPQMDKTSQAACNSLCPNQFTTRNKEFCGGKGSFNLYSTDSK